MMQLYELLGITKERFETKITPLMNGLCAKRMKADMALLTIETSKLEPVEKMFCSYMVGRMCAIEEIKQATAKFTPAGLSKKLFGGK